MSTSSHKHMNGRSPVHEDFLKWFRNLSFREKTIPQRQRKAEVSEPRWALEDSRCRSRVLLSLDLRQSLRPQEICMSEWMVSKWSLIFQVISTSVSDIMLRWNLQKLFGTIEQSLAQSARLHTWPKRNWCLPSSHQGPIKLRGVRGDARIWISGIWRGSRWGFSCEWTVPGVFRTRRNRRGKIWDNIGR
jgi:hypothetical protein